MKSYIMFLLVIFSFIGCSDSENPIVSEPQKEKIEFVADWGWNDNILMVAVLNHDYENIKEVTIEIYAKNEKVAAQTFLNNYDNDFYRFCFENKIEIKNIKAYSFK